MMKLIYRLIKAIHWKYALGEVILIFFGISLALWFNNWNESLKQHKIELETLQEIRNEILLDTVDVNFNIRGYQSTIRSDSIVEQYWLRRLPPDSILYEALVRINANYSIIFHYSAYLTLQSRGLEVIKNDSLRQAIVRLYDFDYRTVEMYENREYTSPEILMLETERVLKHFYMDTGADGYAYLKIKDLDRFFEDKDFYTVHKILMVLKMERLRRYEKLRGKM